MITDLHDTAVHTRALAAGAASSDVAKETKEKAQEAKERPQVTRPPGFEERKPAREEEDDPLERQGAWAF